MYAQRRERPLDVLRAKNRGTSPNLLEPGDIVHLDRIPLACNLVHIAEKLIESHNPDGRWFPHVSAMAKCFRRG